MDEVAETAEFFAPSNLDAIDALVSQYNAEYQNIQYLAGMVSSEEMQSAISYCMNGNREMFHRYIPEPSKIFNMESAQPALDAAYWQRALDLTDVLDYMPDAKRREWHEQIRAMNTPAFEEDTVRATLETLLSQRMDFLAEMVDGLFRGLSGEHVTNRPEAFGRRMIVDYVYGVFGMADRKAGLIHDLRCIIAKFMGRGTPQWGGTMHLLEHLRKTTAVWHDVDGGAFRVRVYKKGTAHMEIHPEIASRLNQILAHLHPAAIPPRHRQKPSTKPTKHVLMDRPLPFYVIEELREGRVDKSEEGYKFRFGFKSEPDKHARAEAMMVLRSLGGAEAEGGAVFDYYPKDVIDEVMTSGAIPDQKAYQFYPTPSGLAEKLVDLAQVESGHKCLEPSAGNGAIADKVMADLQCVEVSALNCGVLKAKGHAVDQYDFLEWSPGRTFDRVLMNPPFDRRRAKAHLEAAAKLLAPGGRLVAILPLGLKDKDLLPGYSVAWEGEYPFPGTSITVAVAVVESL